MSRDNLIIANDPVVFNVAIEWYKKNGYIVTPQNKKADTDGTFWLSAIVIREDR